ncbi:hypothetical protein CDL12_12221 [Handroanthus impetiginosus]|uniref:Uncharacterized protein n=1 Tax=Handroanthus impetiginosus TaxID=429701 RepID=A0A2G9HCW7_9LAMI|nr:hypothetical protein CDL12_12221 [Handroanthus impetiginosus]
MDQSQKTLHENQASRKKTNHFFILLFIILFPLTISAIISAFTALKRRAESQTPNPSQPIQSSSSNRPAGSLPSLKNHTHKIHPSDIVGFSICLVFHECSTINLLIDSLNQLSRSQDVEIMGYDEKTVKDLRILTAQVKKNTGRCLVGLDAAALQQIVRMKKVKMRIKKAEIYVLNSLEILEKKGEIDEMFDQNFGSILVSFMLHSVGLFCLQYLAMVLLFCVLIMRVFHVKNKEMNDTI